MNPAYIYFKEIDIDNDNNFTLNFAKDNEIENVVFNKNYEYAITSLKINAELPDNKIIKIEQTKKLEQKSKQIQEIIEKYKKIDLTLYISHPETNTLQILFVKKSETEIPRKKYAYFNTTSKKTEEFLVYDYMKHLTQYGFNWENTFFGFRYFVKIVGNKL